MKAITTKYLGPTDCKGSRVKADDGDGNSITLPWRNRWDSEDNHAEAARSLCRKMGWKGKLQGGGLLKAGRTVAVAWVFCDRSTTVRV